MKKITIATIITLMFTSFTLVESMVYVCKGASSKVYHKTENCKGLSHCSTQIYKVTEDEAKKMGRRQCKIEYKK
jgi:hypothetical protein